MRIGAGIALSLTLFVLMVPAVQGALVGHWTFDEASSGSGTGIAADSSGSSYDGTLNGGAAYTAGRVGSGALQFNGSDSYVSVPYQTDLALADSDFTISYWSKWDGPNSWPYQMPLAMEWGNSWEGGWFAAYNYDGTGGSISYGHTGGTSATSHSWTVPQDDYAPSDSIGSWDHLCLIYDKETQNRDFYVNGELKASVATPDPVADRGADPLVFGMYAVSNDPQLYRGFYGGALDDIQIYNHALSPEEVVTVADGGVIANPPVIVGAGVEGLSRGHNILLQRGLQLFASSRSDVIAEDANPSQWDRWNESNFTTVHLWQDVATALSHMPAAPGLSWSRGGIIADLESYSQPYASTLVACQFGDEQDITEPSAQTLLKSSMAAFHENQPNVITYTNQWGSQIYTADLAAYMREVQPDMLCFDTYPFNGNVSGGSPGVFYQHMQKYRKLGLAGNDGTGARPIPVALYTQAFVADYIVNNHLVSESEIRLNYFSAWAFGYKMIDSFVYATDSLEPDVAALFYDIGSSSPRPQFYQTAETNRQSLNLGPALVRLISTDVRMKMGRHKGGFLNLYNVDNDLPSDILSWSSDADPYIANITATNQGGKNDDLEGDVIVGYFKPLHASFTNVDHEDDIYFMIVNGLSDPAGSAADCSQLIHLDFDFGASGIDSLLRLSRETGQVEEVSLVYNGGSLYSLDLYLDGGTGDLFKFNNGGRFVSIFLPGDANADGKVNEQDAAILAENWQTMGGATWAMGDFNSDGLVNDADATILAANWQAGLSGSVAKVPEPSVSILLAGILGILIYPRKSVNINVKGVR